MFEIFTPPTSEAFAYAAEGIFIQDVSGCDETLSYYFPQETEDYPYHA
jgi:hypothetical protein